jgi:hypothetical protein
MGEEAPPNGRDDRIAQLEQLLRELKSEGISHSPPAHSATEPEVGKGSGAGESTVADEHPPGKEADELPDGFSVFTGRWRRAGGSIPRAAFQRRGNLSLNRATYEALGSPEAVVLGYNEARREVAIKGVLKSVPYASPVRRQANADSYLASARAFTQSIRLELEESALVFDEVRVLREGLVVLRIDEGRRIMTRSRRA